MKPIDPILDLLQQDARQSPSQIAEQLKLSEADVAKKIAGWELDGTILGYHATLDPDKAGKGNVTALIEVKLKPERGGGFDRVATRISKFDQVHSCWLISGGYDLSVVVEGEDLRDVARFVAEKLSTLEGVVATATHFYLKAYKQNGFLAKTEPVQKRLPVTP